MEGETDMKVLVVGSGGREHCDQRGKEPACG